MNAFNLLLMDLFSIYYIGKNVNCLFDDNLYIIFNSLTVY